MLCFICLQFLEDVDATPIFADGGNLLHEAVALAGHKHLEVLLKAVRSQMTPADMMAESPMDRRFLDYIEPATGKTALYKVGWLVKYLLYLQGSDMYLVTSCECSAAQKQT